MHDNQLRNTLAERFEGYGSQPSDAVWAAIEGNLDQDKRKRGFFWWWIGFAGAAAAVIVLLLVTVESTSTKTSLSSDKKTMSQTELQATENQNTQATSNAEIDEDTGTMNSLNAPSSTNLPVNEQAQSPDFSVSTEPRVEGESSASPLISDNKNRTPEVVDQSVEEPKENRSAITAGLEVREISPFLIGFEGHNRLSLVPPRLIIAPRWELSAEVSTFSRAPEIRTIKKSIVSPNTSDNTSLTTENLAEPSSPNDIYATHTRYAELQLTIRRNFGRRFQIGAGLSSSYSKNIGKTVSGDYQFKTNIWSVGVPLHIRFTALKYRRFSLTPYLSILNEFHFSSYSSEGVPPSNGSAFNTDPAISSVSPIKQRGYAFGVQPSVELSYYATERLSFSTSFGYRNYFVRDYLGLNPSIRQPNYFQFAIGTAWILK